jgi:glutathione S-transferase
MLVLRASPSSPFVRKVRMAIDVVGLTAGVKIEPSNTMDASDSVRSQNPLGKIPTLLLEDGTALYDSRVIVEYLDERAGGGKLIPANGKERLLALRLQALADGIMDAGVLQIYEKRWRPEDKWVSKWTDHQAGKVARGFASLEQDPPDLASIHIGHLGVGAALGWFDFRFEGSWRPQHPRLVKWLDEFAAKVPSFKETMPSG